MCPFKAITGLPCPGCGMTRAFLALFSGDIATAFDYHPLFWLVIVAAIIVLLRKQRVINKAYSSNFFWTGLMVVVIGVYFYRMWHLFPETAPLDFDNQAWIPRLFLRN